MRQTHVAGDKAFVDFSGKKIHIIDAATCGVREAEIFVSVLGASNLTYAEATWTCRAYRTGLARSGADVPVLGCVGPGICWCPTISRAACTGPRSMIPGGRIAATAPWRHITVSGILPARPYHPKDKAKVEAGARIASVSTCWADCTQPEVLLSRRMQRGDHRDSGAVERAGDAPSRGQPAGAVRDDRTPGDATAARLTDHEYAEWAFARVGIDYHIEVAGVLLLPSRTP